MNGTDTEGELLTRQVTHNEPEWALNPLAVGVAHWRRSKRFYTPATLDGSEDRDLMLGKLMLVVSEVAEAAEAVRAYEDGPADALINFEEELADTIIRLMDICGTMGIDIDEAIKTKMMKNWGRPDLHGKSTSI